MDRTLLDAAAQVFAEVGFRSATPTMIAAGAGCAVADVTTAYPTLAELLLAVLTARDDAEGQRVGLLEQCGGLELLQAVKVMVQGQAADPTPGRMHTMIAAEAIDTGHPAHRWALDRYRWMRSLFAGAIRRDIDAGLIRPDVDPDHIGALLIAVMDGAQLQWLLDPAETSMSDLVTAFIDGLADDIAVTE